MFEEMLNGAAASESIKPPLPTHDEEQAALRTLYECCGVYWLLGHGSVSRELHERAVIKSTAEYLNLPDVPFASTFGRQILSQVEFAFQDDPDILLSSERSVLGSGDFHKGLIFRNSLFASTLIDQAFFCIAMGSGRIPECSERDQRHYEGYTREFCFPKIRRSRFMESPFQFLQLPVDSEERSIVLSTMKCLVSSVLRWLEPRQPGGENLGCRLRNQMRDDIVRAKDVNGVAWWNSTFIDQIA